MSTPLINTGQPALYKALVWDGAIDHHHQRRCVRPPEVVYVTVRGGACGHQRWCMQPPEGVYPCMVPSEGVYGTIRGGASYKLGVCAAWACGCMASKVRLWPSMWMHGR